MDHSKKLDAIKKKQYYRENVLKRNNEIIEEKKTKTLWKLEKIALRGNNGTASIGSDDRPFERSRASF